MHHSTQSVLKAAFFVYKGVTSHIEVFPTVSQAAAQNSLYFLSLEYYLKLCYYGFRYYAAYRPVGCSPLGDSRAPGLDRSPDRPSLMVCVRTIPEKSSGLFLFSFFTSFFFSFLDLND